MNVTIFGHERSPTSPALTALSKGTRHPAPTPSPGRRREGGGGGPDGSGQRAGGVQGTWLPEARAHRADRKPQQGWGALSAPRPPPPATRVGSDLFLPLDTLRGSLCQPRGGARNPHTAKPGSPLTDPEHPRGQTLAPQPLRSNPAGKRAGAGGAGRRRKPCAARSRQPPE